MPKVRQIVKPHPRLQKLQRERRKRDGVYKSTYLAKVDGQVKIPGTGLFWVHDPAGVDANGNTIYGNTRKMPMLAGAAIDPRPNLKVDVQTIRGVDYIVRMNRAELDRIGYDVHQTNIVDPSLKFALIEHLTNFQAFATPGTGTVQVNGSIYRKRDGTYGIFSSTGGYDLITGNTPSADMQVVVCMWFDVDTEDVVLTVSSEESRSTNLKNPANIATRLTLINECVALAPEGSIGITAWVIYDDTTAITNNNKLDDLRGIIGQGGGLDDTAIHTDIAGEIEALDEKGTPVGTDIIVIEDSEDSYAKKKVQFDNLPGGTGTDPDAIHINIADEYDTASAKGTPVAADRLLIEDSEDSFDKKYIEIGDLPAGGGSGIFFGADGIAFTDPTLQTWTAHNQGSGNYSDPTNASDPATVAKRMTIAETGDGTQRNRGWRKNAPSTPYTITVYMQQFLYNISIHGFSLFFRESSTGKLVTFDLATGSTTTQRNVYVSNWTDENTAGSNLLAAGTIEFPKWMRISDNGTNLIFSLSPDGVVWSIAHSVGRTAHMAGGANQVGWGVRVNANFASLTPVSLRSWEET